MRAELNRLSKQFDNRCPLVFGGRASTGYRRDIEKIGGRIWASPLELIDRLH